MNEFHIKFKPFIFGCVTVFVLLIYLAFFRTQCSQQSAYTENVYQQQVPPKKLISSPFTVYAVTPTFARPVQKAELTRYLKTKVMLKYKRQTKNGIFKVKRLNFNCFVLG